MSGPKIPHFEPRDPVRFGTWWMPKLRSFRRGRTTKRNASEPLRVSFVITSMPVGGAETLLVNLIRRLDRGRILPEILCLKEPGPLGEELSRDFSVRSHWLRSKRDVSVVRRLANHFRRSGTDAVITVGAGDKMFWGRLAAAWGGVPAIVSALHSTGWPDGVGRLNRMLTPMTDAFIAVAEGHGEFLERFEGIPQTKVAVIRNGIDCDRFCVDEGRRASVRDPMDIAPETMVFATVAALRPEKNHSLLLDAAAIVARDDRHAQWWIIGDGPERAAIEAKIDELNLSAHVRMLGNRDDTERYLAAADAFVLSSLNEASPVSILEAMACGLPVIATDVGSVHESVIEGTTGWLVPSGDREAMAAAMKAAIESPSRRRQFGSHGRRRVEHAGSLLSMVEGYTGLIERLCGVSRERQVDAAEKKVDLRRGSVPVTISVPAVPGTSTWISG